MLHKSDILIFSVVPISSYCPRPEQQVTRQDWPAELHLNVVPKASQRNDSLEFYLLLSVSF